MPYPTSDPTQHYPPQRLALVALLTVGVITLAMCSVPAIIIGSYIAAVITLSAVSRSEPPDGRSAQ